MTDYYEERARFERCSEEASALFNIVVAPALAEFHEAMTLIPDPKHTPRYDRAREAAIRKYKLTSVPAWALRDRALQDLVRTGEVSAAVDAAMTMLRDVSIKATEAA